MHSALNVKRIYYKSEGSRIIQSLERALFPLVKHICLQSSSEARGPGPGPSLTLGARWVWPSGKGGGGGGYTCILGWIRVAPLLCFSLPAHALSGLELLTDVRSTPPCSFSFSVEAASGSHGVDEHQKHHLKNLCFRSFPYQFMATVFSVVTQG